MLLPRSFLFGAAAGLLACTNPPKPNSSQPQAAPDVAPAQARSTQPAATPAPAGPLVQVAGVVRVKGAPSLPPLSTNASVQHACGAQIPDRTLQVDEDGGLVDAVVSVDAPPAPEAAALLPAATLDQKQCDYAPHVFAAQAGATLTLLNSDPLTHSLHGTERGRTLFNFAQPITGMRNQKALPASPGVVEIRCELHPWMQAWVKVFDDRTAFTVTQGGGRFTLPAIPPGRHTLTVWQPRLGEHAVQIDVRPGMKPIQVDWRVGG